ncbi:peptidase [Actinoplanes sp. NPDC051851]|uniref:peptidase n=1 Tax=Actinoplanes sp. NPDC051851 TaxID=3154753 RepID=UPI00342464EF
MRIRHLAATAGAIGAALLCIAATPSPAPAVSSAGTSFLTAVTINAGSPVQVGAVTGDYLYWSFTASAGQRPDVTATVTLPTEGRTGDESWIIEVFDGLRRRQACVAGEQSPVAAKDASTVELGCRLRQVRSWAEPWDGDPLPGTYYVRLSSTELPENDLGLPLKVDLTLATPAGDVDGDQGELAAPLVPNNKPGTVLTTPTPEVTSTAIESETGADEDGFFDVSWDWLPDLTSRWAWTVGGGVIAAVTGLIGFSFTRKRRRVA